MQLYILLSLFISRFVFNRRCYIDKLRTFHTNRTSICLKPTSYIRVGLVPSNMFKPSSSFLLTVPRRCFFCGFVLVIGVSCMSVILSYLSFASCPTKGCDCLSKGRYDETFAGEDGPLQPCGHLLGMT